MAYYTLQPDPYYEKDGKNFYLQYDPDNGNVALFESGIFAFGTYPVFFDGKFRQDFLDNLKITEQEKNDLFAKIQTDVRNSYTAAGGSVKGKVLPPWADASNQGKPPDSVGNPIPGNPISGLTSSSLLGNLGLDPFLKPLDGIQAINEKFDTKGDDILSRFKILKYPIDILENQQDTLHISQFRYQPPRADIFKNPADILTNGLTRSSVLKESLNTVILPIPNNAADGNSVSWGPDNMNNLSAAVTGAVLSDIAGYLKYAAGGAVAGAASGAGAQQGGQIGLMIKLFQDLASKAANSQNAKVAGGTALGSKVLNMAGFQVEAESILARAGGIVPNSNLELLFGGPSLREFTFTYRMSPRSSDEAREIKQIIRSFKQGMAARKIEGQAGAPSYYLSTPNVFKLTYKTGDVAISGMNKFKICALTGFTVNYVPDGQWAAYEGGQPVSYLVSMNFQELEPLYETDYRDDVTEELLKAGDQDPVGLEDVGY